MSTPKQNLPLDIDRIRALVPHAGSMCLLHSVVAFDDISIRCETRSHLDRHNPLRRGGHLSGICGIEYAAQAMALHGALKVSAAAATAGRPLSDASTGAAPRHGYLASVRDARCSCRYLDTVAGPLIIDAELVFEQSSQVIYSFEVAAGGRTLLSGRAAVVTG